MAIINHPTSVNAGSTITITWEQLRWYTYSVERQINNASNAWVSVPNIFQNRFSETASAQWNQVRYRVTGIPNEPGMIDSGTTDWIAIIGGGDPDPDPPLSVPTVLTPQSVTPNISFNINWTDMNGTTAEYDIEESVNGGNYQRIASNWGSKSYSRTPSSAWNVVKYRVRAIRNVETSAWGYSADIIVETIFPKMSVKVGSEVRNAVDGWVKVNGTLRKITDMWVMVNGTLKKS
jgi:hypothetical protein